MFNFKRVRPKNFVYKSCNLAKLLRQPFKKPVNDPSNALGRIKGDIFVIRLIPLNNRLYRLVLVNRKTQFRFLRLLKFKNKAVLKAKSTIKGLYNTYRRYLAYFYYNGGKEIRRLLLYLTEKGINFSEFSPYIYNQNRLIKRFIKVILKRLRAVIVAFGLPLSLQGYVIGFIVKITNRTVNFTKELTPYQLFLNKLVPLQALYIPDL